jgi:cell division protein FtsB
MLLHRGRGVLRQFWISGAILAFALALALADGDAGIRTWLRLHGQLRASEARITALEERIEAREQQAARLRGDDAAIEAAIREDLGMARPGETVVRFPDPSSHRIP